MDFPPKVVASVTSPEEAKEALELGADIIEVRVDLASGAPEALVESIFQLDKPIIVTIRPTWEGGAFTGSDSDRADIFQSAHAVGRLYRRGTAG